MKNYDPLVSILHESRERYLGHDFRQFSPQFTRVLVSWRRCLIEKAGLIDNLPALCSLGLKSRKTGHQVPRPCSLRGPSRNTCFGQHDEGNLWQCMCRCWYCMSPPIPHHSPSLLIITHHHFSLPIISSLITTRRPHYTHHSHHLTTTITTISCLPTTEEHNRRGSSMQKGGCDGRQHEGDSRRMPARREELEEGSVMQCHSLLGDAGRRERQRERESE